MLVLMDNIATRGIAEHVRKDTNSCARTGKEKKISFCLKRIQYMMVKTGPE